MKLCKDCKYLRAGEETDDYSLCSFIKGEPDLVWGGWLPLSLELSSCYRLRNDPEKCGPDGKWWEPK